VGGINRLVGAAQSFTFENLAFISINRNKFCCPVKKRRVMAR